MGGCSNDRGPCSEIVIVARIIGTLSEKSLHAALKDLYAQPGDVTEYSLGGYVVDIVRGVDSGNGEPQCCIEIQTRSLLKMKKKLTALLDSYPVHVVHPIAAQRFLVRVSEDGVILSRRKSPRHGAIYDVFSELVSLPMLACHPNFSLEVLLIHEEEIWLDDGRGSWRRKRWSIHDRRLLEIVERVTLASPADFAALLPGSLPDPFDSKELALALKQQRYLAQKMAYCLREMGLLKVKGKRGNALLYSLP